MQSSTLPTTGVLRLTQIIGCDALTETEAKANREHNRKAEQAARAAGVFDAKGNPKYPRLPTTPRPAITPIIPVCASTWWCGVQSGRYPSPIKLGPKTTAWRVEDIRKLLDEGATA